MSSSEKFDNIGYDIRLETDPDKQTITGLFALAQNIQNLLLIEPGTYPNQPDLGVGISNEQFELLDDITLTNLKERIDSQIDKFIPYNYSIQTLVTVEDLSHVSNQKMLVCGFVVRDEEVDNSIEPTIFNIIFAQDIKKQMFSKIII